MNIKNFDAYFPDQDPHAIERDAVDIERYAYHQLSANNEINYENLLKYRQGNCLIYLYDDGQNHYKIKAENFRWIDMPDAINNGHFVCDNFSSEMNSGDIVILRNHALLHFLQTNGNQVSEVYKLHDTVFTFLDDKLYVLKLASLFLSNAEYRKLGIWTEEFNSFEKIPSIRNIINIQFKYCFCRSSGYMRYTETFIKGCIQLPEYKLLNYEICEESTSLR